MTIDKLLKEMSRKLITLIKMEEQITFDIELKRYLHK